MTRDQEDDNKLVRITVWNYFCSAKAQGSGWSYVDHNAKNIAKGKFIVGFDTGYEVDCSFATCGTSSSDISENMTVFIGRPHNGLYIAAVEGNMNLVRHQLKHINEKLDIGNEWTALHGAVFYNQLEVVEYLLKNGADFRIQDKFGYSALTVASILNFKNCCELLKKYITLPADLEQHNKELSDYYERMSNVRSTVHPYE